MSKNLEVLIAAAAELRAGGLSWDAIAKELHRPLKTCQNWPNKQPRLWAEYFRPAQLRLWEQMAMEARAHLHAFMRDKDTKLSYKANELIMKHSAAAYGPSGTVTHPQLDPAAAGNPNEKICQRFQRMAEKARTEVDRQRANEGKPPATDSEFMIAWKAEIESQPPNREPIKVYFDKEGNAIDPPGETKPNATAEGAESRSPLLGGTLAAESREGPARQAGPTGNRDDGRSPLPGGTLAAESREGPARQAGPTGNRDLVWGVLLFAAFLTGRSVSADSDRSDKLPGCHATSWQLVTTQGGERRGVSPTRLIRDDTHVGLTPRRSPMPPERETQTEALSVPNEPHQIPFVEQHVRLRVQFVNDKAVGAGVAGQHDQPVIVRPAVEVTIPHTVAELLAGDSKQVVVPVIAGRGVVGDSAVDAEALGGETGDMCAGEGGLAARGPPRR